MRYILITTAFSIILFYSCNNENDELASINLSGKWDALRIDTLINTSNSNIVSITKTTYEINIENDFATRDYYNNLNGTINYFNKDTVSVEFNENLDSIILKKRLGFEPNLNTYLYNTEKYKIITNSDALIELYTAGNINSNVFDFRKTAVSLRKV